MSKELYFSRDIADLFDLNIQTVRRWCASGRLRASRVGKSWIVTDDALNEFLKKNEKTQPVV